MKNTGWRREPVRHSMAAKGIRTTSTKSEAMSKVPQKKGFFARLKEDWEAAGREVGPDLHGTKLTKKMTGKAKPGKKWIRVMNYYNGNQEGYAQVPKEYKETTAEHIANKR